MFLWNNTLPNDGIIKNKVHHPLKKILYFGKNIVNINATSAYILNAVDVVML